MSRLLAPLACLLIILTVAFVREEAEAKKAVADGSAGRSVCE